MSLVSQASRPGRAWSLLSLLALLTPSLCFADTPAVPRKVGTVEGITEYRLANGLRLLLFPDPSAATVTVSLTVLVGSRHEGYGETGMAHLLEHMMFKGTPSHPDIPGELRDRGASFNGTTSFDRTNYFETMPAGDANLEFGIRLEADRLVNSRIRREDLASEMTVVRNEFEAGENDPLGILLQRMMAAAYEWHNYGKATIGNRSDIERVPIERLQAFYHKYYRPDNALLLLAGPFEEARALGWVSKYFGVLKRPAVPLAATYTAEPPQDGERTVVLRRVGAVAAVGVLYHIPAGSHEDFAPLEVLKDLLASEPNGRLYRALVLSKKASSVHGFAQPLHDPGVLGFFAQVEPARSLGDASDTLLRALEDRSDVQLTAEDVERSKRKLLTNYQQLLRQSNRVGISLSNWAALGDWRLFFLHRDRLARVTPADVLRVAERYLQRSNRTVGLYVPTPHPQRVDVPPTPAVAELVRNYRGKEQLAAGEAFEPTPANIEARVKQVELPGGVKAALLPHKTRGEAVVARLTLRYGNEESLKGLTSAAGLLGTLMTRGTKHHTRQQLHDALDKLEARLYVRSGGGLMGGDNPGQVTAFIQCKRASLPAVLHILGEILREPTFPPEELDVLKRRFRETLEQSKTDPQQLALRALRRKLNPYPRDDVRYVPTVEEALARLDAVTLEQVRGLYAKQLGAQAGEFIAVGDFDPAAVEEAVREALKDWKPAVPYRHIPQRAHTAVPGSREDILTPDKANAVYVAGLQLALSDTDPDFAALALADYILGSAPLSSRLAVRIRQKEGLSYQIGMQLFADARDKFGECLIFAICNPANIDRVDRAVADELARFVKDGVKEAELRDARRAYLEHMKGQRAGDAPLAALLEENLYGGRTFAYYAELEARIAGLTPEAVNAALRRYLVPGRLVIVRGGDFHKKAPENQSGVGPGPR